MKTQLAILFLVISPLLSVSQDYYWIIQPQYDEVYFPYSDSVGFASAKQNGLWGKIDKTGAWIIEPQFEGWTFAFSEGLAVAKQSGKYGYVDKTGKWAILPQFEHAVNFSNGLACVYQNDNKVGYIDKAGKWAIQPQFEDAKDFWDLVAVVKQNGMWGLIDINGNWIVQPQFEEIRGTLFSDSGCYAAAKQNGKYGYIDKKGIWVIQPQFEEAFSFWTDQFAEAKQNGKWGLIDKTGRWIIEPQFNYSCCRFYQGQDLVPAKQNGKRGYIDKTFKWIIQPQFQDANYFSQYGNMASVKQNGKWGCIEKTGKWVIQPQFDGISNSISPADSLIAVKQDTMWGFIDKTGKWVIQPQFQDINIYYSCGDGSFIPAKQNGKWGFISRMTFSASIKIYVEKGIAVWQKKGEYEKSTDYQKRVNEKSRNSKILQLTAEALKQLKSDYAKKIDWNELQLSEYDADHETYLLKSSKLGNIAIPVSIAEAPSFKQNWSKMQFSNLDFFVVNEKFYLAKATLTNPSNGKTYHYDSKQPTTYTANNITYNFASIEVEVPKDNIQNLSNTRIENKNTSVGLSEIDINIPNIMRTNPHAYALIIGNEDYSSFQMGLSSEVNVDFAINDAILFKKYCINTFGIPESNIKFYTNATAGQINQSMTWINKIIQKEDGVAEVIVYYSGHGLPDEHTKEPYIIPVDISGNDVQNAIKLQTLYNKLTEYPSKKITVFLDACFSGGSRGQSLLVTRGVKVKPKNDVLIGNLVIFTSSSGDQSSLSFKDKHHGMFTYYLLKKMQETKGNISYQDLYNFVRKEVDLNCVKVNSKEQTPDLLFSPSLVDAWKSWKINNF